MTELQSRLQTEILSVFRWPQSKKAAQHGPDCVPERVLESDNALSQALTPRVTPRLRYLLLGIPSGFARRAAGRLGDRRTSPAARSLLSGS